MERTEIIVVSGLPRSGTSLMMSMLGAGGVELLTDGLRGPDADNPRGYFELERVKRLAEDASWLGLARGKAVKVISSLLRHLPSDHRYQVLFMRRDLDEILASQGRMLDRRGVPRDLGEEAALRADFVAHLEATSRLLRESRAFEVHEVGYGDLLAAPDAEIGRIAGFLGRDLDRAAMADRIDPSLYRVRRGSEVAEAP